MSAAPGAPGAPEAAGARGAAGGPGAPGVPGAEGESGEQVVALTRRERQRAATYEEIVEVSRRLLRSSREELSLRGVAAEMGMTPPALYRYVDSYAELLSLVARSIFGDVVARLVEARDRHPDDDPAAQIVACSSAFRTWALGNPEEYRMVFASPTMSEEQGGPGQTLHPVVAGLAPCAPDNGADQFAAIFSEVFGRLYAHKRFRVPADEELDPSVLAVLRQDLQPANVLEGFGEITPGMVWTFERAWARLYGTVTLEVFGHLHPEFIRSGAMYSATMRDIASDLDLLDDWDRLLNISRGPAGDG